jgi:hypothetical protein
MEAAVRSIARGVVADRLTKVEVYIKDPNEGNAIYVTFALKEYPFISWIRDQAYEDIGKMCDALWRAGYHDYLYSFAGTLPLVDKYGQSSETIVLIADMKPDVLSKINFDYYGWWDNLPVLADPFFLHPAIRD